MVVEKNSSVTITQRKLVFLRISSVDISKNIFRNCLNLVTELLNPPRGSWSYSIISLRFSFADLRFTEGYWLRRSSIHIQVLRTFRFLNPEKGLMSITPGKTGRKWSKWSNNPERVEQFILFELNLNSFLIDKWINCFLIVVWNPVSYRLFKFYYWRVGKLFPIFFCFIRRNFTIKNNQTVF